MIKPIADRIIVQQIEPETKTKGGVFIPDNAKQDTPQEAIVLAVGPGPSMTDDGRPLYPIEVKVGDHILFTRYGRSYFEHDNVTYVVIRKHNVLAIMNCNEPHEKIVHFKCKARAEAVRSNTIADAYAPK